MFSSLTILQTSLSSHPPIHISPKALPSTPLLFTLHRQESAWHGHSCSFKYQRQADVTKSKPPGQISPSISGITYPTRLLYLDVLQVLIFRVRTDHIFFPPKSPFLCYGSDIQVSTQDRNVRLNLDPFLSLTCLANQPQNYIIFILLSTFLSFFFLFLVFPFKCLVNLHANLYENHILYLCYFSL